MMSVVYRFANREQDFEESKCGHRCSLGYLPWFIWIVSVVQVVLFILKPQDVYHTLMYSHSQRKDLWRYISYMLLHSDAVHLVLNITLQCLIATPLEYEQSSLRTGLVYIAGGLAGSIGTSVLDPDLSMVGASAGIYAMLISHLPHIVLNFHTLKYKSYRMVSVCSLCIGDVTYNALHPPLPFEPVISWPAHLCGALAGLIAGFVFYTSHDKEINTLNTFIKWFVIVFVIILLVCVLLIKTNFN